MHFLTKADLGLSITQLAKLKSGDGEPREDQTKQLERWMEHCSKPYTQDLLEHPGI